MLKRNPKRPTKQRSIDTFFGGFEPREKVTEPLLIESAPVLEVVEPPLREDLVVEEYHTPIITAEDYIFDSDYISELDEVESSFNTDTDESDEPYSAHSSPTPTQGKKQFEIHESSQLSSLPKEETARVVDIPMPEWKANPIEPEADTSSMNYNELINLHYKLEILEHRIQVGICKEYQHPALALQVLNKEGLTNENKKEKQHLQRYTTVQDQLFVPTFWEPRVWDDEAIMLNEEESFSLQETIKTLGWKDGNTSQVVTRRSSWRPVQENPINRALSTQLEPKIEKVSRPKYVPSAEKQHKIQEEPVRIKNEINLFGNVDLQGLDFSPTPFSITPFPDDSMSQDLFGFHTNNEHLFNASDNSMFGLNNSQDFNADKLFQPLISDFENSQETPAKAIEASLHMSDSQSLSDYGSGRALHTDVLNFDHSQDEMEDLKSQVPFDFPEEKEESKVESIVQDIFKKEIPIVIEQKAIIKPAKEAQQQKTIFDLLQQKIEPVKKEVIKPVVESESEEVYPKSEESDDESQEINESKTTKKKKKPNSKCDYTVKISSLIFDTDDSTDETDFDDF